MFRRFILICLQHKIVIISQMMMSKKDAIHCKRQICISVFRVNTIPHTLFYCLFSCLDPVYTQRQLNANSALHCQAAASSADVSATPVKKKRKQHRIGRPCLFCQEMQTNLSRHIVTKHSNQPDVQIALKEPDKARRIALMSSFKKKGIMKYNENLMRRKDVDPELYGRERASKCVGDNLVICSICKGCYSSTYFFRHKRRCTADVSVVPQKVPLAVVALGQIQLTEEFKVEVLGKFTKDDVGVVCANDEAVIKFGAKLFENIKQKPDKFAEVKKSTMQSMRRLSHLYLEFQRQCTTVGVEKPASVADMLHRRHFERLRQAIKAYTSDDTDQLKAGLKHHVYYLVVKFAKFQKVMYLIEEDEAKAKDVDNFMELLNLNSKDLLGDALYKLQKNRQTSLRKPQEMPTEDDVAKVKEFTISRVAALLSDKFATWDAQRYAELRDLVVCRLTLFNARRGGEPARLLLSEWRDGQNGVWLDSKRMEKLSDVDEKLFAEVKLTYQAGKGDKHLVPVLIPRDVIAAMEQLSDPEVREQSDVLNSNIFMFPTTHKSTVHVNGWHSVNRTCRAAAIQDPSRLTATKQRHRVSTLYAGLDVNANDREAFYQHMGHSKEMNANVYQAPLAEKEIRLVGSHLLNMDKQTSASAFKPTTDHVNKSGTELEKRKCNVALEVDGCPGTADESDLNEISLQSSSRTKHGGGPGTADESDLNEIKLQSSSRTKHVKGK